MDFAAYLQRIGLDAAELRPDAESLRILQRSHLLNIPFENLDIHLSRPIAIDVEKFFEKIVKGGRGGFCYELNGLFNELLRHIGFTTRLISASVFNGKTHGPEFDHAAILVDIGVESHLADVGFGEFAAEPLRFVPGMVQSDATGLFSIEELGDGAFDVRKKEGEEWVSQYVFRDKDRELAEFAEMCNYQQYSPDSHFTKKKVCSIMIADGRKTLTDTKFIVTSAGARTETPVEGEDEFDRLLAAEFGIGKIQ